MSSSLSQDEIRHRMTDWRNLKMLHVKARKRIALLSATLTETRQKIRGLRALVKEKDRAIRSLNEQLLDKEQQRKELMGYLYKEGKKTHGAKQSGKKLGSPGYHRPKPKEEDVTERRIYSLAKCPLCKGQVGAAVDSADHYEEDIDTAPRKTVRHYTITRHWCSKCETFVKCHDIPPLTRIGINVMGYILYARYRLRLPYNKIRESLKDLHDFSISEGEIDAKLKEAETLFGKDYEAITQLIQTAKIVYADETGWRMDGQNWWLWVFVTDRGVKYLIEHTRGGKIARDALGEKKDRVIVSDGYAVYASLPGENQQCWVHLIREARKVSRLMERDIVALYVDLCSELTKSLKERDPPRFSKLLAVLETKQYHERGTEKVQSRMKKHHDLLLTCLRYEGVLPENNTAERAIRPQVVMRKIFGGSRSVNGARTHAVNTSVIETKLKQVPDTSFFDVILPLLQKRRSGL